LTGLAPGHYALRQELPSTAWQQTAPAPGAAVQIDLAADEQRTGVQLGALQLPGAALRTINGSVFLDADADGVKDADETGYPNRPILYVDANNNGTKDTGEQAMPNVTITLTGTDSFSAAVSRTATTGTDGSYKFDNLNPGNYKLKETQPTGQLNNLPILDGEESVGSQGGTKSANDELTITLAEGVGRIPRGTHDYDKFIDPDTMRGLLAHAGLECIDFEGIAMSPTRGLHLSDDLKLNYLVAAKRSQ